MHTLKKIGKSFLKVKKNPRIFLKVKKNPTNMKKIWELSRQVMEDNTSVKDYDEDGDKDNDTALVS
jgi:hypothetical protein